MRLKNILLAPAVLLLSIMLISSGLPYNKYPQFFKIGHRGTRGLMPENTIPAMIKAIELGCNTIEFDVHITKDGKVVVYHDASFNPEYTQMPDGSEIPVAERKKYTFYQMNYADIRQFRIGLKKYPAFLKQQQMDLHAPLLSELIDSVELYTKSRKLPKVNYLLEIKSGAATDGFEQPAPEIVVNKVMADVKPKKLGDRLIIQSFDMRPLQILHKKHPKIALGFLTGDYKITIDKNLADLGFIPQFYNPHYGMVTPEMVSACHNKKMLICPWTVNELAEIKKVQSLKVDGIITDYPNYFAGIQN